MARPLYQQGTNRIEIVVRKEEAQQMADGDTAEKVTAEGDTTGEQQQSTAGTSATARFRRVTVGKMTGLAKEIANTGLNYWQHLEGLRNGDQALADTIDRTVEVVQDVTGTASHIAMGVMFGASGGIPGMLIGGATSAISSAISLSAKYANRQLDFDYKRFIEDNGTAYLRARASINLTTGRLR